MAARKRNPSSRTAGPPRREPAGLRIIGGRFRGRRLHYGGDLRLRPMKNRVREAIFNLLGPAVEGKHALDLFAGTGALGLEALSRGASRITLIEQHFPTAAIIRQNVATLDVEDRVEIVTGDVFVWWKRHPALPEGPWAVFCSPPYDFYVRRTTDVCGLLADLLAAAPAESLFAVESDDRFDLALLPQPDRWDVRRYPPAVVAVFEKPE